MKHVVPENQPDRFYDNAIGILRIFAAASVMLLHYTGYALYVVRAGGRILEVVRHITELFPGVVIFFTISGYLCARSCEKYQAKEFLIRRGKRILPPIWLCTLVNTVFLMIVAGASLPSLLPWIITQLVGLAWTPDSLKSFATGSVNGALWTIFVQLQLYVLLALWQLRRREGLQNELRRNESSRSSSVMDRKYADRRQGMGSKRTAEIFCLLLCMAANLGSYWLVSRTSFGPTADKLLSRLAIPYAVWFVIGVLACIHHSFLIQHAGRIFVITSAIWLCWHLFHLPDPGYYTGIVTSCLLCLMSLSLAYILPPLRLGIDFTYEIFLYHWIVLNFWIYYDVMEQFPQLVSLILFIIVSCAISLLANRILAFIRGRIQRLHYEQ